MKQSYRRTVSAVIGESDIVIYVLDARFAKESRNKDVEMLIKRKGKKVIFALTKCDMAGGSRIDLPADIKPFVMVSAKDYHGISKLKLMILIEAKRRKTTRLMVGVIGYPNVGKSSLINAITGRGSAPTSSQSGFTKGKQYIAAGKFLLIDTPGVIPLREGFGFKHIQLAAIPYTVDAHMAALKLLEENPGAVESYLKVAVQEDKEETLKEIAIKNAFLLKGGIADVNRASKFILRLYQEGKFR